MVHHMGQARDKDLIVWSEQALRTQYRKTRLRVGLRQQRDHVFTSCFAAGKFIGEAVRAKVLFDIAMVVIIKIERRRGDMNEVANAPGHGPLAQTASCANVGQIEGFLSSPR